MTVVLSGTMDSSPSRSASDMASEATSSATLSCASDSPDRNDQFNYPPIPNRDVATQSPLALRSEEYRQLFRLPSEEVLVQYFNCAFQETILLQGHIYLFGHFICFYSNIFGFETKKIIPFHEITAVKRAKTAGIFPNAIEIISGGRKYFFASFMSRDEAFKLISDGWLQHCGGSQANAEQLDSSSETSSHGSVVIEKIISSKVPNAESSCTRRENDISSDSSLADNVGNDASTAPLKIRDDNVERCEPFSDIDSFLPAKPWSWDIQNSDAPKIPECYTKVAETKFQMNVEDFFTLFFSDNAVNFFKSFHAKCGHKDLNSTSWHSHDKIGHTRDVSFQHPIKIYFGAKFGSCQETQIFRLYRNSYLVVETSQVISDVPYGDYFRVEALWNIERDDTGSKEGCILRVYVNVAFCKRTVWKGKIVQSTLEECRDVYAVWMSMAHDMLKQKNLEKPEEGGYAASTIQNCDVHSDRVLTIRETSESLHGQDYQIRTLPMMDSVDAGQGVDNPLQGNWVDSAVITLLRENITKLCCFVKSQSHVIAFIVIFLMQVSIIVLLNKPQHIHMASLPEYTGVGVGQRSAETTAWLEKRMHYLKDEMLMVEARMERMRHEHGVLKSQLKDP